MDEKLWRVKNLTNEDVDVPWAEEAMDVAWAVETVMMAVSLPVAFTRSTLERKNSNNKNSTNRSHRPPSRLARCLPEDSQAYLEELRKRWHQHGDSTRCNCRNWV